MRASHFSYTQQDFTYYDRVLKKLCKMIERGQDKDPDHYGMVAACLIDPGGQEVYAINHVRSKRRVHAERAAVQRYQTKHGNVPPGSVMITTLSPCSKHMPDRLGASCTDLMHEVGIAQVYCGYSDPTQDDSDDYAERHFEVNETADEKLRELCKRIADTFLK